MKKIILMFLFLNAYFDMAIAMSTISESSNNMATHGRMLVAAERHELYLPLLQDKKVGLLVNSTSMIKDQHLVDFLISKDINIRVIFAPEHGFRGNQGAGEIVVDGIDTKTNLPIVSLHGKTKKPNVDQMQQLLF